jgi:hypothetical protein
MMVDRWSSPKQDGSQEQHLCFLTAEGSCDLKIFMSQGKKLHARQPLAAVAPVKLACIFRKVSQFRRR